MARTSLTPSAESDLSSSGSCSSFHDFPRLPAELRLRIWQASLGPRVIEVHARRSHYADDVQFGGVPKWQSRSTNPAALSVNSEARAAALEYYTIRIPLATVASCERAGDSVVDLYRVLYLNPAVDTLVVLGDADFRRMSLFSSDLRRRDPAGEGLKRLAISASWTYYQGAGAILKKFVQSIVPGLTELVVFLYAERAPPAEWTGGVCTLDDCSETDYYKWYTMGWGPEIREGNKWMIIGKTELRVMELNFSRGW